VKLEGAEHGNCEDCENDGQAAYGPGRLQHHLQILTRPGGGDAQQAESHSQTQDIGDRQQQAASRALPVHAPSDDARQDGVHGKDAGRERQQHAEAEKGQQHPDRSSLARQPVNEALILLQLDGGCGKDDIRLR